ncbi:hypothetical protein PBRA_005006 [Plasmodiophora brassicae]|uniref:RanBP2-type domain-containing protein n=1 Tax=Plasmodiophora brassicae TaxID=37360 RepID=A0A0G4IMF3_PLABS|nr:hypothetical protein PBRA_005006 [Plasmodiophora brassicae]
MGVKGLWTLLSACGRRLPLSGLSARVLAIDASLWLVQFLKAMRDEDGKVRNDAHLVGMIRRICRLLVFGIRPVFVFDGPAPMLKRKTLAARRRLRDRSEAAVKRTAEKILLAQLKVKTIKELRERLVNGGDSTSVEISHETSNVVDEFVDLFGSDDSEDDDGGDDLEIDVPDGFDVNDPIALAALPYSMQFEIMEKLREDRAHDTRVALVAASDTPSDFSGAQLSQFLSTSAFNRRVNQIRENMNVDGSEHGQPTHAIASQPDSSFYFVKAPEPQPAPTKSRQLSESWEAAEPTSFRLDQLHMTDWTCAQCDFVNMAIRNSCQRCRHGRLDPVQHWSCPFCATKNRGDNSLPCVSCKRSNKSIPEEREVLQLVDRSAEIDNLFSDDEVEYVQHVVAEDSQAISLREDVVPETPEVATPEVAPAPDSGISKLLNMRNSRLNFYLLQRKSSLTKEMSSASQTASSEPLTSAASPENTQGESCPPTPTLSFDSPSPKTSPERAIPLTTGLPTSTLITDSPPQKDPVAVNIQTLIPQRHPSPTRELSVEFDLSSQCQVRSSAINLREPAPDASRVHGDVAETSLPLSDDHRRPQSAKSGIAQAKVALPSSASARASEGLGGPSATSVSDDTVFKPAIGAVDAGCWDAASLPSPMAFTPSELSPPRSRPASSAVASEPASEAGKHSHQVMVDMSPPRNHAAIANTSASLLEMENAAQDELAAMNAAQQKQMRDADHVTSEMIEETQQLLRLFGIPFIVAPAEAEAQCAALETLGLVDGVVTDDSDVFLFGARNVYRHMFSQDKQVERYVLEDFERELGVDREKLIRMALLLGSDYTEGVHGIGVVNAIEIVNAFDSLEDFRDWVYSDAVESDKSDKNDDDADDVDSDADGVDSDAVVDGDAPDKRARLNKFKLSHRNVRRNWQVARDFPPADVRTTYLNPVVDLSEERFQWAPLYVEQLRQFCAVKMGWTSDRLDEQIGPVLERQRNPMYQTKLEAFFGNGECAATIRSKRIKQAIEQRNGSQSSGANSQMKRRRQTAS